MKNVNPVSRFNNFRMDFGRIQKWALCILLLISLFLGAAMAKNDGLDEITASLNTNEVVVETDHEDDSAIRPYRHNPWYWEYQEQPIMLIGASDRDNLWQWTGNVLVEHLDLIQSIGGNYVRNTMSDRNEGDLFAPRENHAMTYHDIYSFAEVSQNNQDALGPTGRKHWENLIFWRDMIASGSEGPMPLNNEKVYGEGAGLNTAAGTQKEAIERFWRNIFGGAASTRFHRPALREGGSWGWGIGISEPAQHTLRAVSMFLDEFDIFNATPHKACETVGNSAGAFCLADIGEAYAVYFQSGRATVHLDPWVYVDKVSVKWLDVADLLRTKHEKFEIKRNTISMRRKFEK